LTRLTSTFDIMTIFDKYFPRPKHVTLCLKVVGEFQRLLFIYLKKNPVTLTWYLISVIYYIAVVFFSIFLTLSPGDAEILS
jgi:hypothetical protein